MKSFVLPDWTKALPNDTSFQSKDVALFFGYKKLSSFYSAIARGSCPEPDWKTRKRGSLSKYINQWTLGYLREVEQKPLSKIEKNP